MNNFRKDVDLQDNEGYTPLHKAALKGHLAVARLLRQYHAYVNTITYDQLSQTPLDCAIQSQNETELKKCQMFCFSKKHRFLLKQNITYFTFFREGQISSCLRQIITSVIKTLSNICES